MKYIDEVCSVLSDEVERRYLRTRDAWQILTDEMVAADEATLERKGPPASSSTRCLKCVPHRFLDQVCPSLLKPDRKLMPSTLCLNT